MGEDRERHKNKDKHRDRDRGTERSRRDDGGDRAVREGKDRSRRDRDRVCGSLHFPDSIVEACACSLCT